MPPDPSSSDTSHGRLPGRPSLATRAARIINPPSEAAEAKAARQRNPPSEAAEAKAARQRNPPSEAAEAKKAGDAIITGGARRMEAKTANPLPTLKKEPIESTAAPPTRLSPREARRIKDEVFKRTAAAERRALAKVARDRKKATDLLAAAGYVVRKDEDEDEEGLTCAEAETRRKRRNEADEEAEEEELEEEEEQQEECEEEEEEEAEESEEAEGDAEEEEEDEEEEQEEETTKPVMKNRQG